MSNNQQLLILTCGGTFDKNKFTRSGKFVCGETEVKSILTKSGATIPIKSLMRKDSLDMDDNDRLAVVDAVVDAEESRIVIIHGTDTMALTAMTLHEKIKDKTAILTGSMLPAVFTNSDASFNLGFALGAALSCGKGVWVAMHGELFSATEVTKDIEQMRFCLK